MTLTLTDVMRLFLHVREAGPNKGLRVEAIQHWSGGQTGDSWCCELLTMAMDMLYQGKSPIPRLQAVQDVYDMAKKGENGIRLLKDDEEPLRNDVYLFVNDADHAHHIGCVTKDGGGVGIAGNTSEDGSSSNGTGTFEHEISTNRAHVKYVRY